MTVQPPADKTTQPGVFVHTTVSIAYPDAAEISLKDSRHLPGMYFLSLSATQNPVHISLGGIHADREAEAKAMDRLAEVATEAAARLRAPLPAVQPAGGA
ncbi:hypothetical protein [Streptosporangium sp. CA-115845]|uniref:hypothetical protein n=1 Tax=Streptosporangium sp. CA-115845 TaxID=3240071 RepID=UPI003D924BC9